MRPIEPGRVRKILVLVAGVWLAAPATAQDVPPPESKAQNDGLDPTRPARFAKLTFERMLEPPERLYGAGIGSNYQGQVETLGKHFIRPTPQPHLPRTFGLRNLKASLSSWRTKSISVPST